MKYKLPFLIALLFSVFLHAQQPSLAWAKSTESSSANSLNILNTLSNSVTVDAQGNVYTTGYFMGKVDFDFGPGTFYLDAGPLWLAIFISKVDAAGNFVWAKKIGGSSHCEGRSIAVDAGGNVYTTGRFEGTADFDPGPNEFNLTSDYGLSVFISRLDASGNFVWAKKIGNGLGNSIAVDLGGNVYTTGSFKGTADFDPGPGMYNLSSIAGSKDIFISKLDAAGNFVWAKQIGGSWDDEGNGIKVTAAGNVYTTGGFENIVDFDPGSGTFVLNAPWDRYNAFVSKLDAAGNFVWAKSFGSSLSTGMDIAVDAEGKVYTTGMFAGTVDFDPGPGTFTLTAGENAFVSKLDAAGNFVWAKSLGGSGAVYGKSIALDLAGNVYSTGYFGTSSPADFDPGPGVYNLNGPPNTNVYISKLDASGNFVWGVNAAGNSLAGSIALDVTGNVYATGYFVGKADFDPGPDTYFLTSNNVYSGFVMKMTQIIPCVPPTFLNDKTIVLDASECGGDGNISIIPLLGKAPFQYSINGGATYVEGPNGGYTFQNLAAGTYQLRLKDANGCESAAVTREVKANVFPCNKCTPPTFRNNPTIVLDADCAGNGGLITIVPTSGTAPFMYSIDGGATYVSGPATGYSFQELHAGTYQLRLKDANGCESAIVTKEVRKFFGGPLFRNDGTIVLDASCGANDGNISLIPTCGAAPFMYSIDGGVTYVEGPATGYTFQNLAPGTYQLRLKDAYGTESAIVTREVRKDFYGPCATIATARPAAKGAQTRDGAATLQAYPNPSKGRFQVQLSRFASPRVRLQVVDARGTVLQQRVVNAQENSVFDVDLSGKAKGLYLIRVIGENGVQQTKVLIQ